MADALFAAGPNGTMSVADMYAGIYPPASSAPTAPTASAEGLNVRKVKTVPITIDGLTTRPVLDTKGTSAPWVADNATMQEMRKFGPTPSVGGPAGPRLTAGMPGAVAEPAFPFGYSPSRQNAALTAINGATANRQAELLKQGLQGHARFSGGIANMFAPSSGVDSGLVYGTPGIDPWAGARGPADIVATKQAARAAAPAAPKGLLQTLADMFAPVASSAPSLTGPGSGAPGWSNPAITYSPSNMTSTAVDGSNQSFNPTSMQQSSRWNSGY